MLTIVIGHTGERQRKVNQSDTKYKGLGRRRGATLKGLIDSRMFNGHLNLNGVRG